MLFLRCCIKNCLAFNPINVTVWNEFLFCLHFLKYFLFSFSFVNEKKKKYKKKTSGPTFLGIFPNTLSQMVLLTSPTSSTIQDTLIMPTTHHPSSVSTSSSSSSSFAGSSISLTAQQSPNTLHGRQQFPSTSTQILPATSPLGGGSVGTGSVGHTAFVVPTSIYLPSSRPNGKLNQLHSCPVSIYGKTIVSIEACVYSKVVMVLSISYLWC